MQVNPTRVCKRCKLSLPREAFDPQFFQGKPNGLYGRCRRCRREINRQPVDNGDGTVSVPLTKGMHALIDAGDLELVRPYRWHAQVARNTAYATTGNGQNNNPRIRMHRLIVGPGTGEPDHINGDGLDNRRCNLRLLTHQQNLRRAKQVHPGSTSRFRGVAWSRGKQRWVVHIKVDGRSRFVGYFYDEVEAALAYDRAARVYHGEFCVLNFDEEDAAA